MAYFDPVYVPYMAVALVGAVCVIGALASLIVQLVVSIRQREELRVPAGDPWDGRSLEWATPAPPPEYNFPVIPEVTARDAFTVAKSNGVAYQQPEGYADIAMPKNSAMGMVAVRRRRRPRFRSGVAHLVDGLSGGTRQHRGCDRRAASSATTRR